MIFLLFCFFFFRIFSKYFFQSSLLNFWILTFFIFNSSKISSIIYQYFLSLISKNISLTNSQAQPQSFSFQIDSFLKSSWPKVPNENNNLTPEIKAKEKKQKDLSIYHHQVNKRFFEELIKLLPSARKELDTKDFLSSHFISGFFCLLIIKNNLNTFFFRVENETKCLAI